MSHKEDSRRGVGVFHTTCIYTLLLIAALIPAPAHAQRGVAAPAYAPKPKAPNTPARLDGRVDLRPEMDALEKWRQTEYNKLKASGSTSGDDFRRIDDEFLSRARKAEDLRTSALDKLKENTGGIEVKQGTGGTQPKQGRGLSGDIDTNSLSAKDYQRVKKTAEDMGYKVTHQGDAMTIEELNVTVHRQSANEAKMGSKVGSSARTAETGRGFNEETAYGLKGDNPSVSVNDNLKKAAHTLDTPPGKLSSTELQKMGKMTGRNLEELSKLDTAVGQEYSTLRSQSKMLKEGYSPEAAGIVRNNATPMERAQDLADFQTRAREVTVKSVKATEAWAETQTSELARKAKTAEEKLIKASESGNKTAIKQAAAQAEQAKSELIAFKETQAVAKESALLNKSNGHSASNVMAEAKGINAAGKPPSMVREEILAADRKLISKTVSEPPVGGIKAAGTKVAPGRGAKVMKGAMGLLAIYGIVIGVEEGAKQAGEDAVKNNESTAMSAVKIAGYSVWHGLGFGAAMQTGAQAGEESAKQWGEEVMAGKTDPNSKLWKAWAVTRGVGWGLAEFTGLQSIKDAVVEGGGAVKDSYDQYKAEKQQANQQKIIADKKAAQAASRGPIESKGDKGVADKKDTKEQKAADKSLLDKYAANKALIEKRAALEKSAKDKREMEQAQKRATEKVAWYRAEAKKAAIAKLAQEQAAKAQADAAKVAAAKAAVGKAIVAKAPPKPPLPPGTHEEISGQVKDKNGMIQLTYIKDAAGKVVGGYNTIYDAKGNVIRQESFKAPSPSAPPSGTPTPSGAPQGSVGGVWIVRHSTPGSREAKWVLTQKGSSITSAQSGKGDLSNWSTTGSITGLKIQLIVQNTERTSRTRYIGTLEDGGRSIRGTFHWSVDPYVPKAGDTDQERIAKAILGGSNRSGTFTARRP